MSEITNMQTSAAHTAFKAPALLGGWAQRAAGNCIDTGKLAALGMNPLTWGEFVHLQAALVERLLTQQQKWFEGYTAWGLQRTAIKGANTVTKLAEQEFNLAAQLYVLMAGQATDFIALLENADVAYAYWLRAKLGPLSNASWRNPVNM
jgi:hypothetical protein